MNGAQRVIKWFAVGLAVLIICAIVSTVAGVGMMMSRIFTGWGDNRGISSAEIVEVDGEIQVAEIREVRVDVKTVNVRIERGSEMKIETSETDGDVLSVGQNGGTLYVKEKADWFWNWGGGEVVITLPEEMSELDGLAVENGAGKLEIGGLSTKEMTLKLGAGKAELRDVRVTERTKIDSGAGLLTIKGAELADLDFDMGVGKVELEARLDGDAKIDAGVGKLELTLIGEEDDYRVKVDQGIGALNQDGISLDNPKGKNLVDIDGGVGAIDIRLVRPTGA